MFSTRTDKAVTILFALGLLGCANPAKKRRREIEFLSLNIVYRYHGRAVLAFALGLLGCANPAKKRRENRVLKP